jgi:hypothetical protein
MPSISDAKHLRCFASLNPNKLRKEILHCVQNDKRRDRMTREEAE